MFRVCKTIEIENGHMLSKHPDKCQFPHGHSRKVEFVLSAETLDSNEMVCDFKIIKAAVGDFLDSLDHALCMNTDDPAFTEFKNRYGDRIIGFQSQDPTTELLARHIHTVATQALATYATSTDIPYPLRPTVHLESVRLWETSSSWAEYAPGE
ncbi:MAG: 6-carboxytetrahydropterin synthase [Verrucomicrobiales bacterium]|nr:6-carboxytetrahydropterin synthase [Verrucomicrobiales bacterium]